MSTGTAIRIMVTIITTTIVAATIIPAITVTPMLMITGSKGDSAENDSGLISPKPGELNETAALYRLMTWLSPSFPVGAFSYSSGIEWAVEAGDINNAATLQDWLASMLNDGPGFCDGIFLSNAHRAVSSGDMAMLTDIVELAAAFAPSRERHLETMAQGRAFMEISRAAWTNESLEQVIAGCNRAIAYPVAVGMVCAAHSIRLAPTLHSFLHTLVSNWISAGARLIPLGQTDSQRVLAALEPAVAATGLRAIGASPDDLGSATFRADLASMRHETQYTRLFRS
ncbi:MAG: urease accessory protein UreF [Proteobacteria bacterium]|nr:urease accessory protein UreF [Pseudomonadota bacterium]